MKGDDIEKAVVVPLLQAAVTGCLAACAVLTACLLWRWPWEWAGLAGCVSTIGAWLHFRGEVRTRLDVESGVVQVQPVEPAQPEPARTFALAVTYNEGAAGDFCQFGVDAERFIQWAQGVNSGRSLAEAQWIGARGVFSRGEYTRLLAELLARGYIRRRSSYHAAGYELTKKGAALCRGLAAPGLASPTHSHTLTHSVRGSAPVAGSWN